MNQTTDGIEIYLPGPQVCKTFLSKGGHRSVQGSHKTIAFLEKTWYKDEILACKGVTWIACPMRVAY